MFGTTPRLLPALFLLLATGCGSDGGADLPSDTGLSDADATAEPLLGDVFAIQNPANALSFFVEWTTERPATALLEVDCGDVLLETFEGDDMRTSHGAFVMGLLPGAMCNLQVVVRDADGYEERASSIYEAPAELPIELPSVVLTEREPDQMQPGWTLFNLVDFDNDRAYMLLADELGRYRWYHQRGTRAWDLTVIPGGLLAGGHADRSVMLDWDGTIRWTAPFVSHHDVRPSPWNEGHLLYLGYTRECPDETRESTANEFDLASNTTVWHWNVCEHYLPERIVPWWSHINTIEPVPGERTMILSPRDQNLLFQVDRDTDALIWTLGRGGDFEMAPEDLFWWQHAPEVQPNGNILLFDNGHDPERAYSRTIELSLTFTDNGQPDAARVVWEYVDESVFTEARGEADRLANGDTLITYGGVAPNADSILREVNADGEIVWELRVDEDRHAAYRSERIEPRFGAMR